MGSARQETYYRSYGRSRTEWLAVAGMLGLG
jgi:hypothetical protein